MNRSRSHFSAHYDRNVSIHKPGVIPKACRHISPITSTRHKYELKQKVWPKQTVEAWFQNHSPDDRRAVYSFLNTIYDSDNVHNETEHRPTIARRQRSPSPRLNSRLSTTVARSPNHSSQLRSSSNDRHESRASKHDLGEILETLEGFRHSSSPQEKGIQTLATSLVVPLPNIDGLNNDQNIEKHTRRSVTALDKYTETVQPQNLTDDTANKNDIENTRTSRRYLSHSWRVINPRDDMEPNVRPENNRSSFFHFTKKVYPEYFFIHPDWY